MFASNRINQNQVINENWMARCLPRIASVAVPKVLRKLKRPVPPLCSSVKAAEAEAKARATQLDYQKQINTYEFKSEVKRIYEKSGIVDETDKKIVAALTYAWTVEKRRGPEKSARRIRDKYIISIPRYLPGIDGQHPEQVRSHNAYRKAVIDKLNEFIPGWDRAKVDLK